MNIMQGESVSVFVNGARTVGTYLRPIAGKTNRHRVAIKKARWTRDHWVTVSTKKLGRT